VTRWSGNDAQSAIGNPEITTVPRVHSNGVSAETLRAFRRGENEFGSLQGLVSRVIEVVGVMIVT
jgi:hypothetical protein